jgi:hypothetical protein
MMRFAPRSYSISARTSLRVSTTGSRSLRFTIGTPVTNTGHVGLLQRARMAPTPSVMPHTGGSRRRTPVRSCDCSAAS